jgi:hypothetical protein
VELDPVGDGTEELTNIPVDVKMLAGLAEIAFSKVQQMIEIWNQGDVGIWEAMPQV